MRRIRFALIAVLCLGSTGAVAHADTYTISDQYGYHDPYYNGSPYIPVPASVLYACHSQNCLVPTVASDNGARKGVAYVQPNTTNYYNTVYPGVPNTGAGGNAAQFMLILILTAAGLAAGVASFLRPRRHG